jgi:hypothetical protein
VSKDRHSSRDPFIAGQYTGCHPSIPSHLWTLGFATYLVTRSRSFSRCSCFADGEPRPAADCVSASAVMNSSRDSLVFGPADPVVDACLKTRRHGTASRLNRLWDWPG